MTRIVVAGLCMCVLAMSAELQAQESTVNVVRIRPNLDAEKLQYILSTERKQVFERNMNLNEEQSEVFWGVYHRFEKEKEQLEKNRLRLLGTYIEKYGTLTNDDVLRIVKQSGENQRADLALRQKYFHIYSKKLDPMAAARFLQLDDIVGMVTRLAILGNLPLIGEIPPVATSGESPPAGPGREAPSHGAGDSSPPEPSSKEAAP
jgi:hypothetical protein